MTEQQRILEVIEEAKSYSFHQELIERAESLFERFKVIFYEPSKAQAYEDTFKQIMKEKGYEKDLI